MLGFRCPPTEASLFNFNRVKQQNQGVDIFRLAFASGLEAGIQMVRIAAFKKDGISLHRLADIMEQTLNEFKEEHD